MNLRSLVIILIACSELDPFSIRSNRILPRLGSVIFCVLEAPTPALTHGQRLATQILDEVIATPTIPVFSQNPPTEKVILRSP